MSMGACKLPHAVAASTALWATAKRKEVDIGSRWDVVGVLPFYALASFVTAGEARYFTFL